ncbi:hypothetical protein D9M68_909270 [compost metagenome]
MDVEQLADPGAFFRQEARVLQVALPVLDVDFLVRDVDVAAQHDLTPAGLQLQQVGQEGLHEAELGQLAFLAAGT